MRLASAASAAGRPAKGAGSLRLALIGVFAMVLVIVFVTAYGVGSTTINPRRSKHLDLTESSLRLKQEAVRKCRDANAFLQNGGEVVAAQAIAEMERQREELSRTLALERERVTSARSLLQVCRDALATERSALFGVPDSNVSMRLQWLQRRHAFLEAELAKVTTMSPEAAEQHRRSDIRALQAALVREMYSDSPTTNPNTVSEATCAASPARYSVVFDLGSTGNRVHVYKYTMRPGAAAGAKGGAPPRDVLSGLELAEELFELNYRALSKLEDPVREAPEALLELYLKAKNFVPAELHACTPVEFKATAGLRMLGAVKAAEILAEIRARFLKEPLWLRGSAPVRILDGREEGPLAWLTVNFLLGAFGGGGGGAGSGAAAAAPSTVAIIDLGGGSTQIVFEPDNATFHSMHADLRYSTTLGSRSVHAYQHSYEGYGLHAATKELLFHVQGKRQAKPGAASTNTTTTTTTTTTTAKPAEGTFGWDFIADIVGGGGGGDELEGDEVATTVPPLQPPLPPPQLDADAVDAFPCFAVDYEDPLGVRNVKRDDTGRPVVQPSFAACADQFRDRLLKPVGLNCSTAHCGLAGVFQPPLANFTGDIYAFSFLFDLLGLANTSLLPPGAVVSREKFELKLPDLARVGEGHCAALSLARIAEQAAKGNLGSLKPEYECMYYAYVYALLRYGYEVPEDRVLHVAKKIRGYETAWSLGASLLSLS
ncbi:guanosine diphosphatase [Novymonas esmeraldas]|uniref:Guanosine diphosphatase n=1 Tax=Novymonas esmeraldas TaxID=1808958 RepID=A0AAW0ES28_9TRYP